MSYNGVCLFAYNNDQTDYVKLALLAAMYVKRHMKHNNTCLITTEGDYEWLNQSQGEDVVDKYFDEIVITAPNHPKNIRTNYDSPWTTFEAQFSNSNKHKVIEYTPFDKTLLIDTDFMVRNNDLDYLFDSDTPVAMYQDAMDLNHDTPLLYEKYLNPTGVKMWWSTVIYFDKSETSKLFFDTWAHVADNYDFYKFLYRYPPKLFRTDYCVTVASHILNGMQSGSAVKTIQGTPMQYMDQKDDIVEIVSADDWIFLINNREEPWKNIVGRNTKQNIHVMNKRAMDRHYGKLREVIE